MRGTVRSRLPPPNIGNIMARITSQIATEKVGNRFDLILIAANRARELSRGSAPKVETKNGPLITALREIEQGEVGREYLSKFDKKVKHRFK